MYWGKHVYTHIHHIHIHTRVIESTRYPDRESTELKTNVESIIPMSSLFSLSLFFVCFALFLSEDKFLFYSPGCPRTGYVTRQNGLKHTEICLPLPPECWDQRCAPPHLTTMSIKLILDTLVKVTRTIKSQFRRHQFVLSLYYSWEQNEQIRQTHSPYNQVPRICSHSLHMCEWIPVVKILHSTVVTVQGDKRQYLDTGILDSLFAALSPKPLVVT